MKRGALPFFTGNQLKIIALVTMTCDHVGMQIFPQLIWLRIIGRLAFPIYAYMIAEGCAHRCAYCAIPGIRGKGRSRPPEMILAEAQALLASGCRELNVIAQDPMLYGIIIGIVGLLVLSLAYPVYMQVTKKEREKIAPEILRLTEELLK